MDYNKKAHSVYLLTYHIVFVTKYRRPVITDDVGDFMVNHAGYLCGRFGGDAPAGLHASGCGTFQAHRNTEDTDSARSPEDLPGTRQEISLG